MKYTEFHECMVERIDVEQHDTKNGVRALEFVFEGGAILRIESTDAGTLTVMGSPERDWENVG